jgi:hypothetical protein
MIVEMLLNNDTQMGFWSKYFTFPKGNNVIVYIIENFKKKF